MKREPERVRRRRWPWVLGGVGVLCSAAVAFTVWERLRPPVVATAVVQRQSLSNQLFETGAVKPTQSQMVTAQQLTGPVVAVDVQPGQTVHVGQVLVELNHESARASVQAAQTAVQQAQAALKETETEQSSAPAGFQSQFAGTLASERTTLAQAQAQLAQAQAALDATYIRATISGTVLTVNPSGVDSTGNPVPIVQVAGTTKQIATQVSEVDAAQIHPGMQARVTTDAYPGRQWTARVVRVANYAEANSAGSGQVEVDLEAANFEVPIGYQVNVQITTATKPGVTVVPYAAIVQNGSVDEVYVVQDGTVHAVTVSLGITANTVVEVTRGLSPGQRVVLNPPASLRDGQAVRTS
ncbi:efflux RND transporter periplasmic adaptor subunit [Alicyclobacillus contaminans]|uniref:efflux RND transporter periplasmic adaptor subunit n=1 Tax=Alicyclobacillus contaminans TaxID=392016 RepID=UPI00047C6B33|nr:efflux RND transporter periplasmic adaptor subunit [Alicyclobacillus contaminans]